MGRSPAADAGRYARLGLVSATDFALHLPLRYEDLTRVETVGSLAPGRAAQVCGTVTATETTGRSRSVLVATLDDGSGTIALRFLHVQPWLRAQLAPGRRILAWGPVRGGLFGLEIVHPTIRSAERGVTLPDRLTPVYPTAAGIGQPTLRSAIARAMAEADLADTLPAALLARLALPPLATALAELHGPPVGASLAALDERDTPGWRRVILDELVAQQLALVRARVARDAIPALPLAEDALARRLLASLPFALTGAQRRVVDEIGRDLAGSRAMHRLLQGDVGSGKTVVAALAAARAIGSGRQAALMAPTEILAEQHWRKLAPWLEPLGVRVAWLAGSLRGAEKRAARAAIADGQVDLAIGTHALVEESTAFPRLGLAIVDEQHRFGVAQRLALLGAREAAGNGTGAPASADAGPAHRPHLLMMSATPIPRTLAMSYCADLDVSVIDELPPGRTPVVTRVIADDRRDEVAERVRHAVAEGRQAYWVCPLIEESEALDLQTALDTHAWLAAVLQGLSVGLVHGRMPPAEKAATMDAFKAGDIDVLVATTVIEVGVDVPNASLMVIEHAERFGLAQLHQLRGRVGRGAAASACVLLYRRPASPTAKERLATIRDSHDGFEIARRDLQLRGPGEFLGARQSGLPMLRFADLERDADLLEIARDVAREMLAGDPAAVERHLERWIGARASMAHA